MKFFSKTNSFPITVKLNFKERIRPAHSKKDNDFLFSSIIYLLHTLIYLYLQKDLMVIHIGYLFFFNLQNQTADIDTATVQVRRDILIHR
jgi:hypothetical protein